MRRCGESPAINGKSLLNRFIMMPSIHGVVAALLVTLQLGCREKTESDVVLFATLQQETAMPILGAFERGTDDAVGVTSRFDEDPAEASTLIQQIIRGDSPPPCDIVWNTGVLETVRLQKLGLLQPRRWTIGSGWPGNCVASDESWCGFAATARVILVNTNLLTDPQDYPRSVLELADEKWLGRCAVGIPTVGNTATHFAVLREQLGRSRTLELLRGIQESALVLRGSRQVAIAVSAGQAAWGVTDSDAAIVEVELRNPVAIVFPDQDSSQLGTLRIPSTVAVLKGAEHPVSAGVLADYLIEPATEDRLSMGNGSEIPLHRDSKFPSRVLSSGPVRWMNADFEAAGEGHDEWISELRNRFDRP